MGDDPGWVKRVWNLARPMQVLCTKSRCWRFARFGNRCLKHSEEGTQ